MNIFLSLSLSIYLSLSLSLSLSILALSLYISIYLSPHLLVCVVANPPFARQNNNLKRKETKKKLLFETRAKDSARLSVNIVAVVVLLIGYRKRNRKEEDSVKDISSRCVLCRCYCRCCCRLDVPSFSFGFVVVWCFERDPLRCYLNAC